jgi:hypothetical protein
LEAFKAVNPTDRTHFTLGSGSLNSHSFYDLAEVLSLEYPDECFRRFLQTVDDVLAITNDAISDAGSDFAQEFGIRAVRQIR